MEDQSMPPLYPEGNPAGVSFEPSHDELTIIAGYMARQIEMIDDVDAARVACGEMTAEEAATRREETFELLQKKLTALETGTFITDPDAAGRLAIAKAEVVMDNLEEFDRAAGQDVEDGDITEQERQDRRSRLLEKGNTWLDQN